jgi:hypothetical protein
MNEMFTLTPGLKASGFKGSGKPLCNPLCNVATFNEDKKINVNLQIEKDKHIENLKEKDPDFNFPNDEWVTPFMSAEP